MSQEVTVIIDGLGEERNDDKDDPGLDIMNLDEEDGDDDDDFNDDSFPINDSQETKVKKGTGSSIKIPPRLVKRLSSGPKQRHPSELRPSPCPQCDTILTGISSLNAHIRRMHLKQRNYTCNICDKSFFSSTHRDQHFSSIHSRTCLQCNMDVCETTPWTENMVATTTREVKCNCGATVHFKRKSGKSKYGNDDENGVRRSVPRKVYLYETTPMKCDECGLIVKGRSNLNTHIRRVHLQSRDHVCTVCNKGFFTKSYLEEHMLYVHVRKCEVCQEFVMESEPWAPDVKFSTQRTVKCSCGASVTVVTKRGRKRENDSTGGSRPKKRRKLPGTKHTCGSCGKIFLKKKNAMKHKCTLGDGVRESKTICSVCKASFENETEMREHVTKMHSVQHDGKDAFTGTVIDKDNQLVMTFEETDSHSALSELTDGSSIQVMHDGKRVPVRQVVDKAGNVISFFIKPD